MRTSPLSRRAFLRLGLLSLSGLAFRPGFSREDPRQPSLMGRVTIDSIDVRALPDSESEIVGQRFRDQIITLYSRLEAEKGPAYNPTWYRIWGGYVHSAYIQLVKFSTNPPVNQLDHIAHLGEISVPMTEAFTYSRFAGWEPVYTLYYETTHWITGVEEGPDGSAWYKMTSELDKYLHYFVPAVHVRWITNEEISPLSPQIPSNEKRIEVDIQNQTLTAYERDTQVLQTKVSTGLPSNQPIPEGTRTTRGRFNIGSKSPSKHMGSLLTSGAPGSYTLPGVPWTSFFIPEYGVAFHGTYWHNNFGLPMSHGCVNMRNADARWLFRWSTPVYEGQATEEIEWDVRGFGTQVHVF
jgi:lipoprotein-anchoring transpeptidase ErfK/SrfK